MERQRSSRVTMTMPEPSVPCSNSFHIGSAANADSRAARSSSKIHLHIFDSVDTSKLSLDVPPTLNWSRSKRVPMSRPDARRAVVRAIQPSPSRTSAFAARASQAASYGTTSLKSVCRHPYVDEWYSSSGECLIGRTRGERRYSEHRNSSVTSSRVHVRS